jgi:uncharacterized protein with GYD domain
VESVKPFLHAVSFGLNCYYFEKSSMNGLEANKTATPSKDMFDKYSISWYRKFPGARGERKSFDSGCRTLLEGGIPMATFFLFGRYSSADAWKGMSQNRTKEAEDLIQKFGGKFESMYALLGERDLVAIATFPGVEQAMKASIALSRMTGISFTTSPAVPVDEFDKLMSDV